MKGYAAALAAVLMAGLSLGCQKQHPVRVHVDPAMSESDIEQIAVFPFGSGLNDKDDPDNEAPVMLNRLFRGALSARNDYKFLSPESVDYALKGGGVEAEAARFMETWSTKKQIDEVALSKLAGALKADAILVGVVDLWQKDEVDYRETSTPATYVGATITLVGLRERKVLFEASDEDVVQGAQSEAVDRGAMRSGSGAVQADRASNMYQAPAFEVVATKVVQALASSIPRR
jgi:hypothetical protein